MTKPSSHDGLPPEIDDMLGEIAEAIVIATMPQEERVATVMTVTASRLMDGMMNEVHGALARAVAIREAMGEDRELDPFLLHLGFWHAEATLRLMEIIVESGMGSQDDAFPQLLDRLSEVPELWKESKPAETEAFAARLERVQRQYERVADRYRTLDQQAAAHGVSLDDVIHL